MAITQCRHKEGGTAFFADGERFVILTPETTSEELVKLNRAFHNHDAELCAAAHGAKTKREWNFAHPGQGRDWPEFRALDRLITKCFKEAGVKEN